MKLVVGLGNPGEKYQSNRHNVGFMFVDYLLAQFADHPAWKKDTYLGAEVVRPTPELSFAKPLTYMNKSGEAVRKMMEHGKLNVDNLLVVHDDLDIPIGKFRIVKGYGPKLHNGLESIQNHLHSMDFLRVRIGVDNRRPEHRIPGIDYVLQDFSTEEKLAVVQQTFPAILHLLNTEYGFSHPSSRI